MQITEIYAGLDRETHLRKITIDLEKREFAPPSAPMSVSPETPVTTSVFLELPPGWDPQYHATPRKQLVVVLQGHLKITTTDGASADFRVGDVFLLDDKDSKGHLSLVQGQTSVGAFLVGIADTARLSQSN